MRSAKIFGRRFQNPRFLNFFFVNALRRVLRPSSESSGRRFKNIDAIEFSLRRDVADAYSKRRQSCSDEYSARFGSAKKRRVLGSFRGSFFGTITAEPKYVEGLSEGRLFISRLGILGKKRMLGSHESRFLLFSNPATGFFTKAAQNRQ